MSGFKKIIPILILLVIVVLLASFLPQIMGTVEAGQSPNISQDYKNQINSTHNVSVVTISATRYISPILGVLVIVIAISYIGRKK